MSGCTFARPDRQQLQLSVAPQVLKCPAEQITVEPFAGETRILRGCGREVMMTCAVFAGGHESCHPMASLKERAAFELDCDASAIKLAPLADNGHSVGVSGCSKRAVYQYVQTSGKFGWILESAGSKLETKRSDPPAGTSRPM